jgi:putative aldouronate transport system substrate-binding protein
MVSFWSTYAYLFGGASLDNQGDKDGGKASIFVPMTPLKSPSGVQYYSKRLGVAGDGMGITTKAAAEKRPVAMKWIDYLFNSPQAMATQQWGVEGVSYTKDSRAPSRKSSRGQGVVAYVTEIGGNQPPRAHQQLLAVWRSWMPQWLEDLDATYQKYYKEPSIVAIQFSVAESDELKAKVPDLTTFVFENVTKFILGQKPMSEFDVRRRAGQAGHQDVQKIYEQRYAGRRRRSGSSIGSDARESRRRASRPPLPLEAGETT